MHSITLLKQMNTRGKKPYDFDAGGKGLELLRLKNLSQAGYFDISFESNRCRYIPSNRDHCPGIIADCPHIQNTADCNESGGIPLRCFSVAGTANASI